MEAAQKFPTSHALHAILILPGIGRSRWPILTYRLPSHGRPRQEAHRGHDFTSRWLWAAANCCATWPFYPQATCWDVREEGAATASVAPLGLPDTGSAAALVTQMLSSNSPPSLCPASLREFALPNMCAAAHGVHQPALQSPFCCSCPQLWTRLWSRAEPTLQFSSVLIRCIAMVLPGTVYHPDPFTADGDHTTAGSMGK